MPATITFPTDPRAIRSREALRRTMLKLLRIKPLDQITIRDITAKSGVGYTTYFRHYPDKDSLLDDVIAEQITALMRLSLPVVDTFDLNGAAIALLSYVDENRPLWTTLLTGGAAGTIREEMLRQARGVAATWPLPEGWVPIDFAVIHIVSGAIELLAWWLRQRDPTPIDRVAEILISVVTLPAITTDKDPPSARRGTPPSPAKATFDVRRKLAAAQGKKEKP